MIYFRYVFSLFIFTNCTIHSAKTKEKYKTERSTGIQNGVTSSAFEETNVSTESEKSQELSNDDIVEILEAQGFRVMNFTDDTPLVFMGDTVYDPTQILPSLQPDADRSNVQAKRLWIDANGKQQVWYYYDVQTQADKQVFEQAVKTWADTSCIQFNRGSPGMCTDNRGHGAVCVGAFGGCFSYVGNKYDRTYSPSSQRMSVEPNGCEMVAAAHEFGHALGLQHEQSRPDRYHYIHVNFENLDINPNDLRKVKDVWFQASSCEKEQMVDIPAPYDYMSIMQYGTSDFAKEDARMIYVAHDARNQYMMDYHRNAGLAQTHYDKYVINVAYKCDVLWRQTCGDNGNTGAKCQNGGFFSKKCKCECPEGFSGSTCGTKTGSPLFPVQDRAKLMLDITEPGLVDLAGRGMDANAGNLIKETFAYFQFLTVVVNAGHKRKRASVIVNQPFEALARLLGSSYGQERLVREMDRYDCVGAGFFYWGDSQQNKMRTECVSSVYNNEVPERRLHLQGRNRTLSIVVISIFSRLNRDPALSVKAAEFKLDVNFHTNPRMQLRTFQTPSDDPGPLQDPDDSGRLGAGAITGIVFGVVAVLGLVGLAVAWKMGKLPLPKKAQKKGWFS